ncbi:glycoside hydrolase family 108 protein [Methylobacterium sp. CM6257]
MAEANLKPWFKVELTFEGGRVDDKADPGGRTAYGVTQRVYNGWRKARRLPVRDVWLIETAEIVDIYKTGYWDKVWGDRLPEGLDIVVADGAINSGVSQSVKWLQRALGVRIDGVMGDATLTAANLVNDVDTLIAKVIAARESFLRALKTFKRFGKGWLRRTQQLKDLGQHYARGLVGPAPAVAFFSGMNAKALLESAKPSPPKLDAVWSASTSTGILAQITQTLEPLQNIERIAHLLTAITVIGVLLGIAGGLYSWWARQRSAKLAQALDLRPSLPSNDNDEAPPEGLHDAMEAA